MLVIQVRYNFRKDEIMNKDQFLELESVFRIKSTGLRDYQIGPREVAE